MTAEENREPCCSSGDTETTVKDKKRMSDETMTATLNEQDPAPAGLNHASNMPAPAPRNEFGSPRHLLRVDIYTLKTQPTSQPTD